MPEGSESGWSGVFRDLVQDFVLLRDVFGYAIPGAAFLLLGSFERPAPLLRWLDDYKPPHWVTAVAVLIASYVLGNVLAAIYYFPTDCWRLYTGQRAGKSKSYTQVGSDTLYYRHLVRDIFVEMERRNTTALLRAGLAVACTFGAILFCAPAAAYKWRLALGLIPLWVGGIWALHIEGEAKTKPHIVALLVILASLAIPLGIVLFFEPQIGACAWLYAAGSVLWAGDVMVWPTLELVHQETIQAAKEADRRRDRS